MGISAGPVRREERTLEIVTYIVAATFIIFYTDVVTPLGLTVWILYFIPLTLTMYLQWKYAPFAAAGGFILLMGVSFFLSPRDTSLLFAVLNRVFFSANPGRHGAVHLVVRAECGESPVERGKVPVPDRVVSRRNYRVSRR